MTDPYLHDLDLTRSEDRTKLLKTLDNRIFLMFGPIGINGARKEVNGISCTAPETGKHIKSITLMRMCAFSKHDEMLAKAVTRVEYHLFTCKLCLIAAYNEVCFLEEAGDDLTTVGEYANAAAVIRRAEDAFDGNAGAYLASETRKLKTIPCVDPELCSMCWNYTIRGLFEILALYEHDLRRKQEAQAFWNMSRKKRIVLAKKIRKHLASCPRGKRMRELERYAEQHVMMAALKNNQNQNPP